MIAGIAKNIYFWSDPLCLNVSLKDKFPVLYET
jgi:hypothetical protein